MKNILIVINGVLIISVAVLFYQVFSLKSQLATNSVSTGSSSILASSNNKPLTDVTSLPDAKIAYINIDTLNAKYQYIADYVKVLTNKKLGIDAQLQSMTIKFQKDYEALQQSAQAGIAPQAELEKQKMDLERQQREIQNKEMQIENLGAELQEKNDELQKRVKNYLEKFNNGKYDYIMAYTNSVPTILLTNPKLEITQVILDGLNADYNQQKEAKK